MGFYDSLGNYYDHISDGSKGRPHKAKKRQNKPLPQRVSKDRDHYKKYERYRREIGKPNGPGKPGAKAGKNRLR